MFSATILKQENGEDVLSFLARTSKEAQSARQKVREYLEENQVDSSNHPVFQGNPRRLEDCKTEEQAELRLQQAALVLKERYSHTRFHEDRAKKDPGYWRLLASSAVNVSNTPKEEI